MSNRSLRAKFAPEHRIDHSVIDAGYMGIGYKLEHPARIIYIQNYTDAMLTFSQNGVDDHLTLPQNGQTVIDLSANRGNSATAWSFSEEDRFYVKHNGSSPTTGIALISYIYATI